MNVQEHRDVFFFDLKEPEYFSILIDLVLDDRCKELLEAQYDALGFFVKDLGHVHVL